MWLLASVEVLALTGQAEASFLCHATRSRGYRGVEASRDTPLFFPVALLYNVAKAGHMLRVVGKANGTALRPGAVGGWH